MAAHRSARFWALGCRAVLRGGFAMYVGRGARVRALPGVYDHAAGTHADVRRVIPEGLSIGVDEMRAIVQIAARRPTTGHWQIVVIEDADRLTEGAANALLKVVEEPPRDLVPAVRAVGGSRGHCGHAAIPV
ncbi:DNA polymerase III subunit delta' [Mycobacterium tuberculosis CAS/NITR204]|uniref:DNA polymerase III subunit delta n=1 Tax=Mycobacterium tuberculosis CAS/NITR204 TaxID=1310114 RepID=R4MDW6_MYCTX|nr:DNA polymerase III subunit delta' [Mycobacterium tuberculosis CAS/NITR204]